FGSGDDGSGGYGGGPPGGGGGPLPPPRLWDGGAPRPGIRQKNLGKKDAPPAGAPPPPGGGPPVRGVPRRQISLSAGRRRGGAGGSVGGLPQQASLINNASPAVDGDIVVVPYPSGDLVALHVADGSAAWTESLSRTRTTSEMTSMSDTARPAIDGGTVFAVGH